MIGGQSWARPAARCRTWASCCRARSERDPLSYAAGQHEQAIRWAHTKEFLYQKTLRRELEHMRRLHAAGEWLVLDGNQLIAGAEDVVRSTDQTEATGMQHGHRHFSVIGGNHNAWTEAEVLALTAPKSIYDK